MALVTSQKISTYYELYKTIEVTYTKEVIQVTGLVTQQVVVKCVGDFWPCVVFSSSFEGAKVVANINSGLPQKLQQANNMTSLRYCFKNAETGQPVAFFVSSKMTGFTPHASSKDMGLFNLQFIQRPPDDLIEIMGRLLEANINSAKRREERIVLSQDVIRKMNLVSKDSAVFIEGVPRRCILRDISFSGAKIIMMGVSKFLLNKDVSLRIDFYDPREAFSIRGKFVRTEEVEGRKELLALAMQFENSQVPMGYKLRINDYIGQVRVDNRGESQAAKSQMSGFR